MSSVRQSLVAGAVWALAFMPASAEVISVKGTAQSTVVQFRGIFPVQTDFNQEIVPTTKAEPPATATARLDRLLDDGTITAAGQGLALFDTPNLTEVGNPNDVGFDLGAFSDDTITTWFVRGDVDETRTMQLNVSDLAPDATPGALYKAKNRVLLSGVMLLTAATAGQDLSGSSVRLSVTLTVHQEGRADATPLTGEVTLAGIENGDAQVQNAQGIMSGLFLPIVDFTNQIPDLPVVRAITFAGVNFPYEIEIIVGQPFDLELQTRSEINILPGGIGAASVFGTPQEGLANVIARVKGNDSGQKLADAVSRKVDTTGQAYANTPVDAPTQTAPLFSTCGVMGIEAPLLLSAFGLMSLIRIGGGRRRRR